MDLEYVNMEKGNILVKNVVVMAYASMVIINVFVKNVVDLLYVNTVNVNRHVNNVVSVTVNMVEKNDTVKSVEVLKYVHTIE